SLLRIDEQHRVGFGESRRVGEHERLAPLARRAIPAGGVDEHVVGFTLARSVKPADQEIAIRQLDNGRRVVVPLLQREDQLARIFGSGCERGGSKEQSGECAHGSSIALPAAAHFGRLETAAKRRATRTSTLGYSRLTNNESPPGPPVFP